MNDFLQFLAAAALGLLVLNLGRRPWDKLSRRRRDGRTIPRSREKTIHFSGDRL